MSEQRGANGDERLARQMPFARHLGIEIAEAGPTRVVGRLTVTAALCTIPDVLHGGAIMAFADTLGAAGTVANLAAEAWTTTIESKTNFIGAAKLGERLVGEATPVHRGRRTHVWQTRITVEGTGKLVAMVTQTQMVLEGAGSR
jgi:1,4-dihydroxy-2-naphthoyl-CoA hydrolase